MKIKVVSTAISYSSLSNQNEETWKIHNNKKVNM